MPDYTKLSAAELDQNDVLKTFRSRFHIPQRDGVEQIYFLGNSLGLQPRNAETGISNVLNTWADVGVEGFFTGTDSWLELHGKTAPLAAKVVGAHPDEVVIMNQLTVNLHLMMVSFYRPEGKRTKILCEQQAFPSDQYLLESQLKFHGLDPDEHLIEVKAADGEQVISEKDILQAIDTCGDELALVLIGGVNYYTGQLFNIEAITAAAHRVGAIAGFDLAHAAGNVPLHLHQWDVDFACWCNYKYLNSGPGAIASAFIHRRYHNDPTLQRFAGWWGVPASERFLMKKGFRASASAEGWQLSTPPVILMTIHRESLLLFEEATMNAIFHKGRMLSGYAHFLLQKISAGQAVKPFTLLTPADPEQRGCQLSLLMHKNGKQIFDHLTNTGIFADWREPDVIRIAPVPLYNTFDEVYRFAVHLEEAIRTHL